MTNSATQSPGRRASDASECARAHDTSAGFDDLAIITCSYGPDLNRCARLCASMDQHVSAGIPHVVIVPQRDVERFAGLASRRRSVLAVEAVVPGRFRQVPGTQRWWLDAQGWPVRGWIMQQITKLSANFATDAEHLLFADSDLQFLRPLEFDDLFRDGRLRLHRIPGAKNTGEHLLWHHRAADLLGLPRHYFGADYVGQLISWRSSHLAGLQDHLAQISGKPWYRSIARSLRVSEYILYGAYVDGVLGLRSSGHFHEAQDLCHCCWFADDARSLADGETPLQRNALALLLQSNLGLSDQQETSIARMAGAGYQFNQGELHHA